eukprot:CAMPEP_0170129334 /NCGR_PEP_ID=MMETSP0020_2-20130122/21775_1 /TAXON_ID=98059 /ORGANISM="Dinobryon sp., Strain UTEXLB2267" /LENGTH=575 /DNA_ID=CAMNT_0010363567 /DNA_START=763 /DNA_END=2490 /DNA_ORIENTATION=-
MSFGSVGDDFMGDCVPDMDYVFEDERFNTEVYLTAAYMNFISESGRRYDFDRHIRRTSKFFTPGKVDGDIVNTGDILPSDTEWDKDDVLLEGKRDPERLQKYYLNICRDGRKANRTVLSSNIPIVLLEDASNHISSQLDNAADESNEHSNGKSRKGIQKKKAPVVPKQSPKTSSRLKRQREIDVNLLEASSIDQQEDQNALLMSKRSVPAPTNKLATTAKQKKTPIEQDETINDHDQLQNLRSNSRRRSSRINQLELADTTDSSDIHHLPTTETISSSSTTRIEYLAQEKIAHLEKDLRETKERLLLQQQLQQQQQQQQQQQHQQQQQQQQQHQQQQHQQQQQQQQQHQHEISDSNGSTTTRYANNLQFRGMAYPNSSHDDDRSSADWQHFVNARKNTTANSDVGVANERGVYEPNGNSSFRHYNSTNSASYGYGPPKKTSGSSSTSSKSFPQPSSSRCADGIAAELPPRQQQTQQSTTAGAYGVNFDDAIRSGFDEDTSNIRNGADHQSVHDRANQTSHDGDTTTWNSRRQAFFLSQQDAQQHHRSQRNVVDVNAVRAAFYQYQLRESASRFYF